MNGALNGVEPVPEADPAVAADAHEAPARGRFRRWHKHALAGVVVIAVLVGGGLRLVPSSQAASTTGQGAASTACAAT